MRTRNKEAISKRKEEDADKTAEVKDNNFLNKT